MDDNALALCVICDDYIFESEVDSGEAYCGGGDPRPPHHNACLPRFVKTKKMHPDYLRYYTHTAEAEETESAGETESRTEEKKSKRMNLVDAENFLCERAKLYRPQKNEDEYLFSLITGGIQTVPVFPCRYRFRNEIMFPFNFFDDFITSPVLISKGVEACHLAGSASAIL